MLTDTHSIPPQTQAAPDDPHVAALASLRTLAVDTLSDLMRRGQPSDGRRQAATTALRYLSQLERLAHLDRLAAQKRIASPALPTPPTHPTAAETVQPTSEALAPAPPLLAPVAAQPAPAPLPPAPTASREPVSLPTRAELQSLLSAVRDTAATTRRADDNAVTFPPALDALPALDSGPLALPPDPRFDPAAGLPAPSRPLLPKLSPFAPSLRRTFSPATQHKRAAAALLTAAGFAPSG